MYILRMTKHHWHLDEFERIKSQLQKSDFVCDVALYGSVEKGVHDEASDLDVFVQVNSLLDLSPIHNLFEGEEILGQERYQGETAALVRILLASGRCYDIKLALPGSEKSDTKKVPLGGTHEFWFALHAAHHALIRGRTMITFDLLLLGLQQIMKAYWNEAPEAQRKIEQSLERLELEMGRESLLASIQHLAEIAGTAFSDKRRSTRFVQLISNDEKIK